MDVSNGDASDASGSHNEEPPWSVMSVLRGVQPNLGKYHQYTLRILGVEKNILKIKNNMISRKIE